MLFSKFGQDWYGNIDQGAAGSKVLTVSAGYLTDATHILKIRPTGDGKLDVLFQTTSDSDYQRI